MEVSVADPAMPVGDGARASWHPAKWRERLAALLQVPQVSANSSDRVRRPTRAGLAIWLPVWLSFGIGLWFALPVEPEAGFYLGAILVAFLAIVFLPLSQRRALQGASAWWLSPRIQVALMALAVASMGIPIAGLRSHLVAAPVLDFRYYGPIEGRVIGIDRSARDRIRILLDEVRLGQMRPSRLPERVRISLTEEAVPPLAGQKVMLTGHLGPPPGPAEPGGFDFRRNAWFERLGAVGYTRNPVLTIAPAPEGGALFLARLRMRLSAGMQEVIGGQEGAVASALLTGDRSGISEATNEIMRIANLYHIISISGLHMSLLAGMAYALMRGGGIALALILSRPDWRVERVAAVGAFAAALGYLGLSGGGVATERSFLMVAVMLGAVLLGRRAISLRTVALVAAVLLALTPEALVSASFQMSFAATVALILGHGFWMRLRPVVPIILRPVAMLVLTSFLAGLATGPLAAAHFGRIAPYGILANLIAVPIIGLIVMPMGLVAAVLAPFGFATPALWLMGLGTGLMLKLAGVIAGLGGADLLVAAPPASVLPLLGLTSIFALRATLGEGEALQRLVGLASVLLFAAALLIWSTDQRPDLLISGEGEAVGILTPVGRALSREGRSGFHGAIWLENDGDTASPHAAARRPLWEGEKNLRHAILGTGAGKRRVIHHSGKRLPKLAPLCNHKAIIVIGQPVRASDRPPKPDCLILDLAALRASGGIGLRLRGGSWRVEMVNLAAGKRPWVIGMGAITTQRRFQQDKQFQVFLGDE